MPESTHTKTKRIAKNTVLLYLRSLISLFISLFTSRLVLKGLGVEDFGIYGVVGSFVSMFSIVTGSLRGAISRFYNYALGKGDKERLRNTFALSLSIMAILSLIVIVLTETFGLWFLYNRMTIPTDRINAAFWCFQFSVLSSVSSFLVVSFTASIVAHEKMGTFAYIDVGEVVLKFLVALLITFSPGYSDKLILYAALLLVITLSKQMISRVYAMKHFEECRIRWYWNKKEFLEMFSFAGWSFVGKTSDTFSGQGVSMVINVVFGPSVNAARSLAGTVNHAVSIFVTNFTMALYPQMAQSFASGETDYMKSLLLRGSKFSFFIMWLVVLPLLLETRFVVNLWLGEPPEYTITFIQFALLANLVSILYVVLSMGIKASGKIMWYQLSFSIIELIYFAITYTLLHNGFSPEWCYYLRVILTCVKVVVIIILSKKQLGISVYGFIKEALLPMILVSSISAIIPVFLHFVMPYGWMRFLLTLVLSITISGGCILFLGCSKTERNLFISMILSKINR